MIVRLGDLEFEILSENDVVLFGKLVRVLREDDEEEPSAIVKPSANSDKNLEEVEERREEEDRKDEDTSEFVNAGFFKYLVKDNVLKIRIAKKTRQFDYEKVRKLYDSLPEESTYEDLLAAAAKVGLKIMRSDAYALMHFFSRYVDFDAELIPGGRGRGNRTRLVKLNPQDTNDLRSMLELEKSVIGVVDGEDTEVDE
ncbi:hypothetical protein [Geoglobus acetivorans]|uniref:Uncharacterized protein n=1 Tax=Geoglobus acetivorans TaxID=565033 RepID=A0A0A7GD14_GEOAI|nr:hypothetical protein GACE_0877 [Geoglobus acetivorans]